MIYERMGFYFFAMIVFNYFFFLQGFLLATTTEKSIVIVSASRNAKKYCIKNLESSLNQHYTNYRVIWIDDASDDGTPEIVEKYLKHNDLHNKVTFIKNKKRYWACENYYKAIHTCRDEEIIVIVDGDDWLAHHNVLSVVNKAYQGDVWLTYGNDESVIPKENHYSKQVPDDVIVKNTIRWHWWITGHLRTFYAWLFKKIKLEDFMYQGEMTKICWDVTSMIPMVEMAARHTKFIDEVLYIYNNNNELNDAKIVEDYQKKNDAYFRHFRALERYKPI